VNNRPLQVPPLTKLRGLRKGSGKQKVATTMAVVRAFKELLRDPELGKRIVPIVPDEARTFGMDSWFPPLGIYNPHGQNYVPVDHDLMLSYTEKVNGQILHEGISEVLAGIQGIPECRADHEFYTGMANLGHVESQHEFVALTYLSTERRSDTEFREYGNGL